MNRVGDCLQCMCANAVCTMDHACDCL
jgi:hypothetical protein